MPKGDLVLFIFFLIVAVIQLILHLLNISIPFFTVPLSTYDQLRENGSLLNRYHRRCAVVFSIVLPLVTISVFGDFLPLPIRILFIVIAVILLAALYIINKRNGIY